MALLLSVYMVDGSHTVRGLAKELKISKPAVSRALDRLGELGYIRRERDEMDRRNVLVQRTSTGTVFLKDFSALIIEGQLYAASLPAREVVFGVETPATTGIQAPVESAWIEAAA
jgi:DNA-binding MarR family transcriptional regulator